MKKNIYTLLAITALSFTLSAQGDVIDRSTKNVTRVITLDFMKDVYTEQNVLFTQQSAIGLDFNYNKIERGKIFEKGFSVGWQPIDIIRTDTVPMSESSFVATNQMFHLHGTLRKTILKKKPFQPYVEVLAGFKGVALTATEETPGGVTTTEMPHFESTTEIGYAVGFRWEFLDHLAVDMRYARVSTGNLKRIDSFYFDDQNELQFTTDDWKAPLGYFRMGLSLDI